jgi:hypothetical protein
MRTVRGALGALASLAVALVLVGSSEVPAAAQECPILVVSVSDSQDPVASGVPVTYVILVKG